MAHTLKILSTCSHSQINIKEQAVQTKSSKRVVEKGQMKRRVKNTEQKRNGVKFAV